MDKVKKEEVELKEGIKDTEVATDEQISKIRGYFSTYCDRLSGSLRKMQDIRNLTSSRGTYNPILSNDMLTNITFNPQESTSDNIAKWLSDPVGNETALENLSSYLKIAVGQYAALVEFFNTSKTFKYMLIPADVDNSKYINTEEYNASYRKALKTLRSLNIPKQLKSVDALVMQKGIAFIYVDDKGDTITLHNLPSEYCYVTSRWTYGWSFAIDLSYFDKMMCMTDIVPEIMEQYRLFVEKREAGLKGVDLAPFQYYPVPIEKGWVFSYDPNTAIGIPPLSGVFGSAIDMLGYQDLLKEKALLDLWKVIALKIPLDKTTNKPIVSAKEAGEWIAMIETNLPKNYSCFVAPFEPNEISTNQVSTYENIVNLGNSSMYLNAGVTESGFGTENKNAGAIKQSLELTFHRASSNMYPQYENFVNFILSNKCSPFHWQVKIWGYSMTDDDEKKSALQLTTSANLPIEYLMANCGFQPFQVESFINWSNKLDIKSKLKPLQSQFTTSNIADKGGRPLIPDNKISDSGEQSRETKDNRTEAI